MKAGINLKYVYLLACGLLMLSPATAQKVVEKTVPYEGQEISLDLPIGKTIKVTGWDKSEVMLKAEVNINDNTLNEAYQLKVTENSSLIHMEASLEEEMLKEGRAEDCDNNYSFHHFRNGEGTTVCAEITYELKVPRGAALKLETINADVEARGLDGPAQLKSISGFIDFSWPQQKEAELKLQSTTGELYTDLTFDILNEKDNPPIVGYTLKGRNGKGGPLLELETISSNIYLRKE